ncbi:PRA1 family protein 3 [Lucilia cuprina]|nr:PRA1 family protein 3 [Lucilia cuprina]KAI8116320.1 PRA1 family protein 3 [Lucilia cuprina]
MTTDSSDVIQNLEIPPLRTLNDFILGSARFQLPNLKDYDKWGNRVVKNLLYYQTNYFLIFFSVYALMMIFNPLKIICGLLVQAIVIAIILHLFSGKIWLVGVQLRNAINPNQKWYFLAGALLIGYMLLHWIDAVLLTSFTLLLPFSLTFVHASLRLRNLKNKVTNTMVTLNPSTPMGIILDAFNIAADNILN